MRANPNHHFVDRVFEHEARPGGPYAGRIRKLLLLGACDGSAQAVPKAVAIDADDPLAYAYREQAEEKAAGLPPAFRGNAETGLLNDLGWQLQGYIEDARV